ncbi:hypothetical protein V8G54_000636 [Vigna mungo]|uniref:NAC domain-containing protein n=1 Tax=Vigna mungo TaxID=3915 RepID=A0AAQ3P784_VIGMU
MLSNPLHCCLILFLFRFLMPAKSVIKSDDPEWFFFSSVDYKYSNSKRVNRTTEHGFWKATGNDRKIRIGGTNNVIGTKKTLVFHQGRVPRGVKTNWVIHEYHALTSHESQVGLLFHENFLKRFCQIAWCDCQIHLAGLGFVAVVGCCLDMFCHNTMYSLGFDIISYPIGCSEGYWILCLNPMFLISSVSGHDLIFSIWPCFDDDERGIWENFFQ